MKTKVVKLKKQAKNPAILNGKLVLPDKNNINKHCRFLRSDLSDINSGDIGRIVATVEDGYAVELTKQFKVDMYKSVEQTNVIFALPSDIVIL